MMLVFFMSVMILIGCQGPEGPLGPQGEEGPQGPEGEEGPTLINVLATLSGPQPPANTDYAIQVKIYNFPTIPCVTLNDILLPNKMGKFWFINSFAQFAPGDSASLVIDYTMLDGIEGTARAQAVLPEQFELTSHDTSAVAPINWGFDFPVTWTTSEWTDFYKIDFHLGIEYDDTLGTRNFLEYYLDSLVTDTVITIPTSQIFPPREEVDTLYVNEGYFYIDAYNGPGFPGDEGNVAGDGFGFFFGCTYGPKLEIEATGVLSEPREEDGAGDRNALRQAFLFERGRQDAAR